MLRLASDGNAQCSAAELTRRASSSALAEAIAKISAAGAEPSSLKRREALAGGAATSSTPSCTGAVGKNGVCGFWTYAGAALAGLTATAVGVGAAARTLPVATELSAGRTSAGAVGADFATTLGVPRAVLPVALTANRVGSGYPTEAE
jgi:hypothetical protein